MDTKKKTKCHENTGKVDKIWGSEQKGRKGSTSNGDGKRTAGVFGDATGRRLGQNRGSPTGYCGRHAVRRL